MILGALVDSGLSLPKLSTALQCLPIKQFSLRRKKVRRSSISATKVDVVIGGNPKAPRTLDDMTQMIQKAKLPPLIAKQSLSVFSRMANAEAVAHGITPKKVVFHEIGVVDTIVDVVGGLLGCSLLGIEHVTASPLNLGSGFITISHGTLSVPGPATVELVKGIPVYTSSVNAELTTPTGAALITQMAQAFGPMPEMRIRSTGHGAGTRQTLDRPNVLRIFVGDIEDVGQSKNGIGLSDHAVMIETNLDDMNPQIFDLLIERLLHGGALDVALTPVIMKKGRPGIVLGVLTQPKHVDDLTEIIFNETTTLGVRTHHVSRTILAREQSDVKTKYGQVSVKIARLKDGSQRASVEYGDCKHIAEQTGKPLREIMDEARRAIDRSVKTTPPKRRTTKRA